MQAIELIEKLGGTAEVAVLANVKPPSVSEWKANNRIPDGKLIRLALIAEGRGVCSRKILFPNEWKTLWPELVSVDPALQAAMDQAGRDGLIQRRIFVRRAEDRKRLGLDIPSAGQGV